jgi:DNA sulfur modification protein DndD
VNFKVLEVENFGLYAGRQCLDLETRRGHPIVLIGGTNGAGKTTILEAFTLCLHGRRALGQRVAEQRYEAHIRSRLHAGLDSEPASEAEVGLLFGHVHSGQASDYLVRRRWRRLPSGRIRETLTISVDGEEIDDLSDVGRQDFLDSLLPPGLAGFFLFDGEQIQALADDENGEQLADAVKRLLGLDLIAQLETDLRRFAGLKVTGKASAQQNKHDEAVKTLGRAEETLGAVLEQRADLQARLDQLTARVERVRERLAREGGALAGERATVEAEARKAAAEVAGAEEEMRGLIAGLLPFAITQGVADSVASRLELEKVAEEDEIVVRRINAAGPALKRALKADGRTPIPRLVRELLGVSTESLPPRLHDVSAAERAVLLNQLRSVRDGVRADAARLAKRLRRAQSRQDRAERQLQQVPDDDALAPLISELQEAERKVGSITGDMARVEDDHRQAVHELKVAGRELRRVEDAAANLNKGVRSAELALRTVALLEEYGTRAERRRLDEVALEATRYFNRLSRKGELLSQIRIDPETFTVHVARWDGAEMPKDRLSAGEKQLFAIAILWSLARASQRPLPVVVDTPLARLDHEHRRRILREYLPHVSHQVIVLSTDTEVDVAAAAELEPVTARRIFLRHDPTTASTFVEAGYFSQPEEVAAHAR